VVQVILHMTVLTRALPKERPRVASGRAYTAKRTRDYETQLAWSARAAYGHPAPVTCPVHVTIRLVYASRRALPDLDNAAKAILDALNGVVYADDRQVDSLAVSRQIVSGATEHLVVTVEAVTDKP
jgi:Holliday junction resolvase RusA-like endonuclease